METHSGQLTMPKRPRPLVTVSKDRTAALVVLTRCRKVYVAGRRVHHGLVGELLIGAGIALHKAKITGLGAALVLHDRHDFPFPLTDPDGWGPK